MDEYLKSDDNVRNNLRFFNILFSEYDEKKSSPEEKEKYKEYVSDYYKFLEGRKDKYGELASEVSKN